MAPPDDPENPAPRFEPDDMDGEVGAGKSKVEAGEEADEIEASPGLDKAESKPAPPPAARKIQAGDYLALGVVRVRVLESRPGGGRVKADGDADAESGTDTFIGGAGWTFVDSPPATDAAPAVRDALEALWAARWIIIARHAVAVADDTKDTEPAELWRVYVLPYDTARTQIDRSRAALRRQLHVLLHALDVSAAAWAGGEGQVGHGEAGEVIGTTFEKFKIWPQADWTSLFYLFNTLDSPSPSPAAVAGADPHSRLALDELLAGRVSGLAARLYGYQRRSAAEMLRREAAPERQLDPRLELRTAPDGSRFYYNGRDGAFFRNPQYFDAVAGGILAETMGYGKTLICLALVLATRHHWPRVPPQYECARRAPRPAVGSLVDMAAAAATFHLLPWRRHLSELAPACVDVLEQNYPRYEIPPSAYRQQRFSAAAAPAEQVVLSSGTIIVVPKNLVQHWKAELDKHVDADLAVLVADDKAVPLPSVDELVRYDIVLFSRPRFEHEGPRGDDYYVSPLRHIHWLRIIIDEGHSMSAAASRAAGVAENVVRADRRWAVTGTPARDLLGIEVDVSALTHHDAASFRRDKLARMRAFSSYHERSSGEVRALGVLASRFLQARPWSTAATHADAARWDDYVYRHESTTARTYSGFAPCMRRVLGNLVVKTRPEDVERDIQLPPLTHRVVRLAPSFFDKLTANLFVLQILSNAVTSERQDMDYLFHPKSQAHLHRLIAALRQSGFYWTGVKAANVAAALDVTRKYLEKPDTSCSAEDRAELVRTAEAARLALASAVWTGATDNDEMVLFARDWPAAGEQWALPGCAAPPMALTLSHCLEAQTYVNKRLGEPEPLLGFAEAAQRATLALAQEQVAQQDRARARDDTAAPVKSSDEHLSAFEIVQMNGTPRASRRGKPRPDAPALAPAPEAESDPADEFRRKRRLADSNVELPPDHALGRAALVGSPSAKFTYLLDRIVELHRAEKILVFYDGNYIAYYLATMLQVLHIKHLIYSNDVSQEQRGKYLALFEQDDAQRVMMMDLRQAAHGLNVSTASRVFFVNPVCRPNIEAQAMKRAHRLGQSRPVVVETLVLAGTVEEAMHDRASRMTSHEHVQAKTLEDDLGVARVIQQARILPLTAAELAGEQMAVFRAPLQLFGRPGRAGASSLEQAVFGEAGSEVGGAGGAGDDANLPETPGPPLKRRRVARKASQASPPDVLPATPPATPLPARLFQAPEAVGSSSASTARPAKRKRVAFAASAPTETGSNAAHISTAMLLSPQSPELPSPDSPESPAALTSPVQRFFERTTRSGAAYASLLGSGRLGPWR